MFCIFISIHLTFVSLKTYSYNNQNKCINIRENAFILLLVIIFNFKLYLRLKRRNNYCIYYTINVLIVLLFNV